MNYGAILLGVLAVVLIALGFNGTYNDLWETFFGVKLHPIDTSNQSGGGDLSSIGSITNTPPAEIFNPPTGSEQLPVQSFPIPIPNPFQGSPVIKPQPISPGQINWQGLFGNP